MWYYIIQYAYKYAFHFFPSLTPILQDVEIRLKINTITMSEQFHISTDKS
jgi:hypothetical protein